MNFIGIIANMIAIVVLGDYGLFNDGAGVHEDSAVYDLAFYLMDLTRGNM